MVNSFLISRLIFERLFLMAVLPTTDHLYLQLARTVQARPQVPSRVRRYNRNGPLVTRTPRMRRGRTQARTCPPLTVPAALGGPMEVASAHSKMRREGCLRDGKDGRITWGERITWTTIHGRLHG